MTEEADTKDTAKQKPPSENMEAIFASSKTAQQLPDNLKQLLAIAFRFEDPLITYVIQAQLAWDKMFLTASAVGLPAADTPLIA